MSKIWPYAWAFALACLTFLGLKIAGHEWTAERSWGEVIAFSVVAVLIILAFFLRKKIAALIAKNKEAK